MSILRERFEQYLALRRNLGADLSFTERVMRRFIEHAESVGAEHIDTDLFLDWRANYGSASDHVWGARLSMVRGFAQWLSGVDPKTTVPPTDLVPARRWRGKPHIFTESELAELLATTRRLRSPYGLRGATFATLFGLIAATGLRISEALRLDDEDIDADAATIDVRASKTGPDRLLPITPDTVERLHAYLERRNRVLGASEGALFRGENGERVGDCGARYNFANASQTTGLRESERYQRHGHGPRIHDLRHTFAVRTIIDWHRAGLDIDREMLKLSAYLGHANPEGTYWYIEAIPELMQFAAARADQAVEGDRS